MAITIVCSSCSTETGTDTVKVFHYNQHNPITSLDPAFAKSQNNIWAINHIYSTLVQLDDNLEVQQAIATSWTISEDGLIYTFDLRNDVYFHVNQCFGNEGFRPVNAHDVVFSYSRLMDTVLNAPGSWIFDGIVDVAGGFLALDDSTFQINLRTPFAPLLSLLTMQYCSILPREAIEFYGDEFYKNPVGTGPFFFKTWIDHEGLFLLRNKSFFEWQNGKAISNLDGIRTSFISERSVAFLELINGRIDWFSGLESGYVNTALTPSGELHDRYHSIQFTKSPYLNFEYFGINSSAGGHKLLKEKNFRQALNYAVDRGLMLATLRNKVGKPADAGVITRGLPSYDPVKVPGYYYDIQRAIILLSQFEPVELQEELTISTSQDYLDLTTFIAKQWENIGLNVSIEVMQSASLRESMRGGQIPLFRASWIADYPDGESFLSMFYSQNPAPPNYTRFANDRFDQLYKEALSATSKEQKTDLYQRMDSILIEEAPVVFLFYDEIATFVDKSISGLSNNALNLLQVKNIHKK